MRLVPRSRNKNALNKQENVEKISLANRCCRFMLIPKTKRWQTYLLASTLELLLQLSKFQPAILKLLDICLRMKKGMNNLVSEHSLCTRKILMR